MGRHPIRLVLSDDLRRSRLTVFFRALLALPHLVWLALWTAVALVAALANWVATLALGRSPLALHRFLAAYVRYTTHVNAFLFLAANPFPGFAGASGSYPVDVEIDSPERQSRWTTAFRLLLALPALLLASALIGLAGSFGGARTGGYSAGLQLGGVLSTVAFLAFLACLVRGRMPRGFRDLVAYALRYSAQLDGYLFLLTDRYPDSDPRSPEGAEASPPHPIRLRVEDDLRRSRLTIFFRFLLSLPHLVWLALWSVAALLAALPSWVAALVRGRPPRPLHRFLAAYVRYATHVNAYLFLVANPFPGFVGRSGSYPVDLEIEGPARQSRWLTAFRLFLAVPAFLVGGALAYLLYAVGFLGWFAGLVRGRMPQGLRNLGAFALRYSAQTYAYALLLTDRYPYSAPW